MKTIRDSFIGADEFNKLMSAGYNFNAEELRVVGTVFLNSNDLHFGKTRFLGDVYCSKAIFDSCFYFEDAVFMKNFYFHDAVINKDIHFGNAVFFGSVHLGNTVYKGNLFFDNATFMKFLDFGEENVLGRIYLGSARFCKVYLTRGTEEYRAIVAHIESKNWHILA